MVQPVLLEAGEKQVFSVRVQLPFKKNPIQWFLFELLVVQPVLLEAAEKQVFSVRVQLRVESIGGADLVQRGLREQLHHLRRNVHSLRQTPAHE